MSHNFSTKNIIFSAYPWWVIFIIGNEFCERYAYYGMRSGVGWKLSMTPEIFIKIRNFNQIINISLSKAKNGRKVKKCNGKCNEKMYGKFW